MPDLTLMLSLDGLIEDVLIGGGLADENVSQWVGKRWQSTVSDPGSKKVRSLLDTARDERVCGYYEINQQFPSGREMLMEFSAVRPDPEQTRIIAIGKSVGLVVEQQQKLLAAQQSIEREYWKLRDIETRYRAIIESTSDAVILVRDSDLAIVETNSRARQLLALPEEVEQYPKLTVGSEIVRIKNMMSEARESGRAPSTLVHLGAGRELLRVVATPVHGMNELHFLLQFESIDNGKAPSRVVGIPAVEQGLIIVDTAGTVKMVNESFARLVGSTEPAALIGQPIDRWFQSLPLHHSGKSESVRTLEVDVHLPSGRARRSTVTVWELQTTAHGAFALLVEVVASMRNFH